MNKAQSGKEAMVTLYGQERDSATVGLARMNMILHDRATRFVPKYDLHPEGMPALTL